MAEQRPAVPAALRRALLETFAEDGLDGAIGIDAGDFVSLSLRNLRRDGLVKVARPPQMSTIISRPGNPIRSVTGPDGIPRVVEGSGKVIGGYEVYRLTDAGREFVRRWYAAESVSQAPEAQPGSTP